MSDIASQVHVPTIAHYHSMQHRGEIRYAVVRRANNVNYNWWVSNSYCNYMLIRSDAMTNGTQL